MLKLLNCARRWQPCPAVLLLVTLCGCSTVSPVCPQLPPLPPLLAQPPRVWRATPEPPSPVTPPPPLDKPRFQPLPTP